jgi:hypothetical protein
MGFLWMLVFHYYLDCFAVYKPVYLTPRSIDTTLTPFSSVTTLPMPFSFNYMTTSPGPLVSGRLLVLDNQAQPYGPVVPARFVDQLPHQVETSYVSLALSYFNL